MKPRAVVIIKPARKELESILPAGCPKMLLTTSTIESLGLGSLAYPHIAPIRGKLWEIRVSDRRYGYVRAFYMPVQGSSLVILRVFKKGTNQTPQHEIDLALERAGRFLHRPENLYRLRELPWAAA